MRVLLVEDDGDLARSLIRGLEDSTYTVEHEKDGLDGAYKASIEHFDLIILDVMLPRADGFEVARTCRANGVTAPILMLTARDGVGDRVRGLDAGADDYLVKPFAFVELLARIRALLRRSGGQLTPELSFADIQLDPAAQIARRGTRELELTRREFALLEVFLRHPGRVLTRTAISEHVWDCAFALESNIVDSYVSRLRAKLEAGGEPRVIQTIRRMGYVLRGP